MNVRARFLRRSVLATAVVSSLLSAWADVYTSSSYVMDGLVLQFDGIDNDVVDDVRCHNPAATVWKDLTGYGSDAGQSASLKMPVWTALGPEWLSQAETCQLRFTASAELQAVTNTAWTVEFVATDTGMSRLDAMGIFTLMPKVDSSGFNIAPLGVAWWRNIFFMNGTGGWGKGGHIPLALSTDCQGGYAGGHFCADREIAVTFTCPADYSRTDGYYRGVAVGGSTITFPRPTQAIEYGLIGSDSTNNRMTAKGFKGRIHSIRLYNRILTPSEVAFNHKVDRERFLNGVVRVVGSPSEYGAPTPTYGVQNFMPGSTQSFSIADSLVEYPDGVWAIDNGLVRSALADCRVAAGDMVLHTGDETAFDCMITTNCQAAWTFDVQHALCVRSPEQGSVTVNDGTSSLCVTNWGADGRTVHVLATPAEGYKFVGWSGDTEGLADVGDPDITVMVSSVRSLMASFADAYHEPTTCTWKDGVTEGNWSDAACWAGGAVPDIGDTVILPSAATVTLDLPTAELNSLELPDGATLVVSKWFTAIRATTVTVGAGATIRAAGPFLDGAESNRVWIVGDTLTVAAGGRISADGAGYAGTNGLAWVGVTPTLYDAANYRDACPFGGSYGGEQGYMWPANRLCRGENNGFLEFGPQVYGNAERPYDPGSGGGYVTRAGGGAIFLDFTGTVRVDGRVSANASAETCTRNWSDSSYGSGGGVLVNCAKIVGSGVISASCDIPEKSIHTTAGSIMSGGGGGGRIAVHYDPDLQTTADCRVRFLARGGQFHEVGNMQFSRWEGGCGTLWFTDNRLLAAMAGDCPFAGTWLSGVALDEVTFSGTTVFTNGCFRLVGKTVEFGGDVALGGAPDGTFAPYGLELKDCWTTVAGSVGIAGARLAVKGGTLAIAGDLRQMNMTGARTDRKRGGELLALASPTNGTDGAVGAAITVGGRWTMESNAVAYVKCDPTNGASVACRVGSFNQAANATVDARGYGWKHGFYNAHRSEAACGFAPATFAVAGAGHIGLGGGNKAPTYKSYDSVERPALPGSGGVGCSGGGVIWIVADRNMEIAGSLCADSYNPMADNTSGHAAGGTVYLSCKRLTGFPTAKITASANVFGGSYGSDYGSGGGGAIAIWCVNNQAPSWTVASGILNASANYDPSKTVTVVPQDGSVFWGENPRECLMLIIR